ncbi:DNA polymerase-3 subunit gamma/tau [Prevotella aff. ruminicola Tc2-24]|uniref:DNA polymerase III subunit gamma/tau n=1 Tax=Prevotella aff. ruminicola Tc2-24 TaxID=81582 RepID=A0A1I0PP60_9BACT|nr:DNA polymerase III subunit gamma/tau [Prevotella aff. ruminicola Tc2-24]SEW16204.1 DNA polymerase-3 subunit gamma/tau [Prevotella aff. ruminicola Tc2-24]
MEYIVSARKYRPMTFDAVVGQAALTTTLKNAIKSGKLAHAYLFCGPRGVGKTTCARIFAKAINCQNPTAEGEACNECESCQSFNEQRSLNIFELDAASNNSVEHIKTLMEQTRIPPQLGRYKVFIIDEVHMLSTAAFNAFLKTLEEPPAHVIFILATTEKHKILPTILSRCQIYDFERMTIRNTVDHLKHVAEKEGITYEEQALAVIAEKADGGMRDALSIFDQAASFCQGNITYDKVIEDLNVLDSENYFKIIDLSIENKVGDIMILLNSVINKGFDGGLLIQGLAKHVRNVLMAKDPQTLSLLEVSDQQRQRYQEQAKRCETPFLYQALRLMNQCDINYRQSSNKRLLVELTLIEIAQITQSDDDGASAGRRPRRLKTLFKNLIRQSQSKAAAPQVAAAEPVVSPQTVVSQVSEKSEQPKNASNPVKPGISLKGLGYSWRNLRQQGKPTKMNIIPGTVNTTIKQETDAVFSQEDLELQWMSMCNRMPQKYSSIATRMKNMTPVVSDTSQVTVTVDNDLIKDEMEQFKNRIVRTLADNLHNSQITLTILVAERPEHVKVLTRREQFELMSKENPAVEKLRQAFGLELA